MKLLLATAFAVAVISGCFGPQCTQDQKEVKVVDKEAGERWDYGYAYQYGPMCPDNDGDGGFHYGYCFQYGYHYGYFPEESHTVCQPSEPEAEKVL